MPFLWIFLITGGASSSRSAVSLSALISFGRVGALGIDALEAQRPLDGHLPVAEGRVREDLRLLGLLEREERVADALDVLVGQLAVLLAEVLAQRLEPLRGVDELHLARAVLRLAVGEHPDVGGDAGVVEHVERQRDDGLEPVVLDDPAADVALALAGVAGEEREPLCTSAMRLPSFVPCFIFESMLARNSIWPSLERVTSEYSASPACSMTKRGILDAVLAAHALEVALPALAVGRIARA